jgi:2-polyprenyl-6-hydroxyphenyl methylase/3-demethylubiquinone-9 3-methyltransferase
MGRVNNAFYETLNENWYEECQHPIALLRAENALRNPWIEQTLRTQVSPGASILDIGCGGGMLTNYLAERGYKVHGIDLSPSSLEVAKARDRTRNVHYECADATALPFQDGSFDAVCAMDLLEHVESPENVIAEASRVLKKGGLFFFHTFNRNALSWLVVIKGVEWFVKGTPPHMHVYRLFLKPKELERICSANALKVIEWKGVRPALSCSAFWKMLGTRAVKPDFRFTFTRSLATGYSGFARLN